MNCQEENENTEEYNKNKIYEDMCLEDKNKEEHFYFEDVKWINMLINNLKIYDKSARDEIIIYEDILNNIK